MRIEKEKNAVRCITKSAFCVCFPKWDISTKKL